MCFRSRISFLKSDFSFKAKSLVKFPKIVKNDQNECDIIPGVFNFYDDISIVSGNEETEHSHLIKVQKVIARLTRGNFNLNIKKSNFFHDLKNDGPILVLGYELGYKSLGPDREKIKAILNISEPRTLADLQKFLGMVNFCRSFIPFKLHEDIAFLGKSCSETKFAFKEDQKRAFENIKNGLVNKDLFLGLPDSDKSILVLMSDASSHAIGGCALIVDSSILQLEKCSNTTYFQNEGFPCTDSSTITHHNQLFDVDLDVCSVPFVSLIDTLLYMYNYIMPDVFFLINLFRDHILYKTYIYLKRSEKSSLRSAVVVAVPGR